MSRSRRHSPFTAITTTDSEKWWKRLIHGRRRARQRDALVYGEKVVDHNREHREGWGPKDGKSRFEGEDADRLMRK